MSPKKKRLYNTVNSLLQDLGNFATFDKRPFYEQIKKGTLSKSDITVMRDAIEMIMSCNCIQSYKTSSKNNFMGFTKDETLSNKLGELYDFVSEKLDSLSDLSVFNKRDFIKAVIDGENIDIQKAQNAIAFVLRIKALQPIDEGLGVCFPRSVEIRLSKMLRFAA